MFNTLQSIYANESKQTKIEKKNHCIILGKSEHNQDDTYMEPIEYNDPYYWLRDDTRTNETILNILNNENKFTEQVMSPTIELQKELFEELKSHLQESYNSYPFPRGDGGWESNYIYFTKTEEGKSHEMYCRRKKNDNINFEILLDVNLLAIENPNIDICNFSVTKDHKYMAYGIDNIGSEDYELKIYNIDTGKECKHEIEDKLPYAEFMWYYDKITLEYYIYYVLADDVRRMNQIYRYNCDTKENILIYKSYNQLNSCSISITNNNKYLLIDDSSSDTSNIYLLIHNKLFNEFNDIKLVIPTKSSHKYEIEDYNDNLIIMTNRDNYNNFKVMVYNINDSYNEWKDLVIYDKNELFSIENINVLKDFILVSYKDRGFNKIRVIHNPILDGTVIYNLNDNFGYTIEIDQVESYELIDMKIYDTDKIAISYTDLKTPRTIIKYDLINKSYETLHIKPVLKYNSNLYTTEYIYADNVPITLVYKTELFKKDGNNMMYLTGYGAYGDTTEPSFNYEIIPLLDRGFVYAIAQVRGGGYLGRSWYEDGKLLNKKNTFEDFIKCTEHLIENKYTNKNAITIYGASAGGLLIGAVMNMRPDLYKCVIADVPFVDLVVSMADETIPLTTPEWEEWGNTNILEYYQYIKSYSPVHNVDSGCSYPNVLIIGGLNDPRVQYWEPLKLLAKLRETKNNTIKLLKTQMNHGHFGNSDRYESLKDIAFMYAFLLHC